MDFNNTGDMKKLAPGMLMPSGVSDWARVFAMRQLALSSPHSPAYLLAPEIAVLLSYLPDLRQRTFFETMWNTGARPNEALAMTPHSLLFKQAMPAIRLPTLKQRTRGPGSPKKSDLPVRDVPVWDASYRERMVSLVATLKIKVNDPLWPVSPDTIARWLTKAVDAAQCDGVTFSISPIIPKTFRHSFAMHILFNRIHPKVLQSLMGHKSFRSTEVYTKLFLFDVAGQHQVDFGYDVEQAKLAMSQAISTPLLLSRHD
ncbi:site-specific recombinase XerD [Rahnella inusitata]|nr:site-specific recombinase XerD [Rahnella inusitata]